MKETEIPVHRLEHHVDSLLMVFVCVYVCACLCAAATSSRKEKAMPECVCGVSLYRHAYV